MYLYLITNLINNKKYIGITNNYKKRWSNHKCGNNKTMVIAKAIKKYGKENFKFEVLLSNISIDKIDDYEIKYIKKYHSHVSENGYNVSKGGKYNIENHTRPGELNGQSLLIEEEVQYIKNNRNIPLYVLYDDFSEKISYDQFKKIYNDKIWKHIKTDTQPYPYNLEFSNQFTSNNKLGYGDVVHLREEYQNRIYWREAFKEYKDIFQDEWSFWNIYVGNKYKLVMPEVFTEELKAYHAGLSKKGSLNGRSKLSWEMVHDIRKMYKMGVLNSDIYKKYPQVSTTSIRNVINNKTWIE